MKFCTNCGVDLLNKPNFCPSCGSKLIHTESNLNPNEESKTGESENTSNSDSTPKTTLSDTPDSQANSLVKEKKYTTVIIVISIVLALAILITVLISSNQISTNADAPKTIQTPTSKEAHTAQGVPASEGAPASEGVPAAEGAPNSHIYQPDAVTERNIFLRNNWTSHITASRSSYNYSEFGGISDLSIIITNNTEYLIDNLTVKVTIKTVNNYIYKTEYLYFENIKANSRSEQYVMPTDRGRYVDYEIISVYSDRLNFRWEDGDNTGNGSLDDPWKFNN
jgi:uncharacterized Zn finger protein (UPF0148 family)